ncbi:MAG: hypothetical protein AB7I33_07405 [Gemmatimonadales bacterium]
MLRPAWSATGLLGAAVVLAAPARAQVPPEDEPHVRPGSPAPAFALPDREGRRWRLWQARGEGVVVLVFVREPDLSQDLTARLREWDRQARSEGGRLIVIIQTRRKSETPPPAAGLPSMVLLDRDGTLFQWYDADTGPPRAWVLDRRLVVRAGVVLAGDGGGRAAGWPGEKVSE